MFFKVLLIFSKTFNVFHFQRTNCRFSSDIEVCHSNGGVFASWILVEWKPYFQYFRGYSNILETFHIFLDFFKNSKSFSVCKDQFGKFRLLLLICFPAGQWLNLCSQLAIFANHETLFGLKFGEGNDVSYCSFLLYFPYSCL